MLSYDVIAKGYGPVWAAQSEYTSCQERAGLAMSGLQRVCGRNGRFAQCLIGNEPQV